VTIAGQPGRGTLVSVRIPYAEAAGGVVS
jgi:hypothetical protein